MFFKKSGSKEVNEIKDNKSEGEKMVDDYIWIDGYKGTDQNMICNGFKYELNSKYIYDGDEKICKSGYHFCEDLIDCFNYYALDGKNRFFKVKALYSPAKNKRTCSGLYYNVHDTKITAKEIEFIEECTYEDYRSYIQRYMPMIESEDDFKCMSNYSDFCHKKFVNEFIKLGFSPTYSEVIYDKISKTEGHKHGTYNALEAARAYVAEQVSKDMIVFLLDKHIA